MEKSLSDGSQSENGRQLSAYTAIGERRPANKIKDHNLKNLTFLEIGYLRVLNGII